MDVSPYILKFNFFFKNTFYAMTTWSHVDLLQSKSEMIYFPKQDCIIIIHRNTTNIYNFDQVYSNTQVPTQANTNQHKSDTTQHESTRARVLLLIIRTISHTSSIVHKHLQNCHKSFQKFKSTRTYTQLHKPAFTPNYFSNKSTNIPFGGHFLTI